MHRHLTWHGSAVTAAIAFGVALLMTAAGCSKEPAQEISKPPSTSPTSKASADVSGLELVMADGSKRTLSEFRGKVVVLDFWATYCKPCIEKLPHLQQLAQQWGDRVAVVAVTLDPDVKAALAWAKRHNVTLPIAVFQDAMKPALFPNEETIAIPQVRVIGRDGKLAHSFGPESTLEELQQAVNELLAQKQ